VPGVPRLVARAAVRRGRRPWTRGVRIGAAGCALALILWLVGACLGDLRGPGDRDRYVTYPPAPDPPRVVALGNLRSGAPPGDASVRISVFLFGEAPPSLLNLVRPLDVALYLRGLAVCDTALGAVMRWQDESTELDSMPLSPAPAQPVAARMAPNGDLLIADVKDAAVHRYGQDGARHLSYRLGADRFRPADALVVEDHVWVTNVVAHRIEIFDAQSGSHLRSIGRRGGGPGQFGAPLGMAPTPDANVCVVDMLNARIQVLDAEGQSVRIIGGPGDSPGHFGRPKDVVVGPDGTVFVTDAASQRVHAFDATGNFVLAFGQQTGATGGLRVPGGIAITTRCPVEAPDIPEGFVVQYYVLVAEQLLRPGIRVYAWGSTADSGPASIASAGGRRVDGRRATVANPHWAPARCGACHPGDRPFVVPAPAKTDELCMSCHDGVKARSEAHPIGRLAAHDDIGAPPGWPLVNGRLGCLTCHDIRRHCDEDSRRPATNSSMLRAFDSRDPMHVCTQCHQATDQWRTSPHRHLDASGIAIDSACRFCHVKVPPIPSDGLRRGRPMLHADGSRLCLTCHAPHWDVAPLGHIDRPASQRTRRAMAARRILLADGDGAAPDGAQEALAADSVFPLWDGRVTCYSCHNPHQAGLFPDGSALGCASALAIDEKSALRLPSTQLCIGCHPK